MSDAYESMAIDEATADAIEERHAPDAQVMAAPIPELQAPPDFELIRIAPEFRVRINHSNTIKEGWRLSETTVECTFIGDRDSNDIQAELEEWLGRAYGIGNREAALRNGAVE